LSFIETQYKYAKSHGWLIHFANAAAKHGHTTADLMAIASRETNMRNIVGDNGHGYGVMQIDIRSFADFCKSGKWKDVEAAILKGAEVLAKKRDEILAAEKRARGYCRFSDGSVRSFVPRILSNEDLHRVTVASYNCGGAAYYHFSNGNDPDRGTTGKDYSRDVLARSNAFQDLLEADHVAPLDRGTVSPLDRIKPAPVTPTPAPNSSDSSDSDTQNGSTVQDESISFDDVANKVNNDTVKGALVKAGLKMAGPITGLWGWGIHGKVLIILAGLIIAGVIGYETYKHYPRIKSFVIKRVKG
jgi:hypothetical protein